MKKITALTALTAPALALLLALGTSPADAQSKQSTQSTQSEAHTRSTAGLPDAAVYVKGSAVEVSPGVRCFTARARIVVKVDGVRIPRGHRIGYCTDGYVDTFTRDGARVIRG